MEITEHPRRVPDIIGLITKPQYYDPVINPSYWEWAKYYGVAVIPARIREARDKPVVEESVGWLETWLLGWLRNQQFFSFEELNKAILYRLQTLCLKPYQKRPGSRQSVFLEVDKPALRPLPAVRFEKAVFKTKTLPDNYHNFMRVFIIRLLIHIIDNRLPLCYLYDIEIFNKNRERIASHPRRYTGKKYVTNPDHMPEKHRKYWETKQWNGARYRSWAASIGENTAYVIERMLTAYSIEEQAYKSCMGVLQMSQKFGTERLEKACEKARLINSFSYTTVRNILKNGQDQVPVNQSTRKKPLPSHENIRGNTYYQ